uniref:Uncharacterized protein n=1 Tax=Leersia perrieri TaxID=77586 RepID=A0A0D9XMR4_9ORYZ
MRTQRNSSSAATVLSLCKVLLMVIALICTLQTAPVHGGRAVPEMSGKAGSVLDPRYTPPTTPGGSYTGRGCKGSYRCTPPAAAASP